MGDFSGSSLEVMDTSHFYLHSIGWNSLTWLQPTKMKAEMYSKKNKNVPIYFKLVQWASNHSQSFFLNINLKPMFFTLIILTVT